MNPSLAHLPPNKQADLSRLVDLIRETVPDVEMIILYGSYARGDWREESDLKPNRKSGHASDYDILVLTSTPQAADFVELRTLLDRRATASRLTASPRFIAYDIHTFNRLLSEGRFFYLDIRREGRLLYDSGREKLEDAADLSPADKLRIVKEYYEHNFKRAQMFFKTFLGHYKDGSEDRDYYKLAAFDLHQAAEAAYKTILLVHTSYSPDEHWLKRLSTLAADAARDPTLLDILPNTTDEEQRLFMLLDYAYIGARYDAKYHIEPEELDYLSAAVQRLLERAQGLCEAAIKRL